MLVLLCLPWAVAAQQESGQADDPDAEAGSAVVETLTPDDPVTAVGSAVDPRRPVPVIPLEPLPPPEPPTWPAVPQLAEAMADQALRDDALLTIATLMTLRDVPPSADGEAAEAQVQRLLADRAWLDTLIERYGYAEARSPVLDPAAWQVQVQLDRVSLPTTTLASPLGSGPDVLVRSIFDRGTPDLAAASLPELLWHLEASAPRTWVGLQRRLVSDPWLGDALMRGAGDWFDWPEPMDSGDLLSAGTEVEAPEPDAAGVEATDLVGPVLTLSPADRLLAEAQTSLGVMLELATDVGPPDPARLARVRRELLVALPELDFGQRARAEGLLHLAGLVDGLYRANYLQFAEGLVAITARLQDEAPFYPEQTRAFARWLVQVLPVLSESYGRSFSTVDPRLNTVLATAYDGAQALTGEFTPEVLADLRLKLADAVAGLVLMIPDLGFYFDQPIRDPIAGGVDACTGIAGQVDAEGVPAMTRELFDDCMETLVSLANFEAREAQLAGNSRGPFEESQLRRELNLTAGQRINYGIGYLNDRFETGCPLPPRPLPNPLEWAYLATIMAWFAEQSPVYFQGPENEQRLARMRDIGEELVTQIGEQVDCLAGSGDGLNDPVDRLTTDYAAELRVLRRAVDTARAEYRSTILQPGADVRLDAGGEQTTAYRPADMTIGPCDPDRVCEMTGALSSTRALVGLFGDEYLVADQAGLGALEICYDNMGWVDRRMEPVRPEDENVANFFGRLSFDLRGRFREGDAVEELFAFRFTAPEESHYLFSAQKAEILEDACPVEWVGTRIVTPLPEGRIKIVPDRLTYLSAARTLPSRLFESNWEQGTEWRDGFVTGSSAVEELQSVEDAPRLGARLDEHLEALYREEQRTLYGALAMLGEGPLELGEEIGRLTTGKLLLRTQIMLFFPHVITYSDEVRAAMAGQSGLLDRLLLLRGRQQNQPLDQLLASGDDRVEAFRAEWRSLPETVRRRGSIADSVSHALVRLEAINAQFFAEPAEPVASRSGLPAASGPGDEEEEGDGERQL
ncbi:MAG: hypothetical protein V2I57_09060 [Xanthomonadales bacterium]|nr:hypothetical protein [Xanthomonadales bacterium]